VLYIYSADVPALDVAVLQALGPRHSLTVIPVSPRERSSARHVVEYLRQAGLHARLPGSRFFQDPRRLSNIIMNSDAIYLMGGNTFEYLDYARRVGLFDILAGFEAKGGLIMAESAGSIILSPTIIMALVPTTCPDEQLMAMEDFTGMGRIPFHVSPHFDPRAAVASCELDELQTLANLTSSTVWVLQDGEGLLVQGEAVIDCIGEPQCLKPQGGAVVDDIPAWLPDWAIASTVAG